MKALITGSAGFVGRHIIRALKDRQWRIDPWDIANGSMHDAHFLFSTNSAALYDLVVHCAFHVGGRAAIDGDRAALAKNLMLDAAMFDWAVRTKQKRVLYFSSSAVYPTWLQKRSHFNVPPIGYRLKESDTDADTGRPDADYDYAKMVGEQLAGNAREMGVNVHVVRPFSGAGADQDLAYPFPAIVARAKSHIEGEPFKVWGPEGQTRDWVHISDVVAGALAVVDADFQEPVNLCTGIGTTFGDLATMALAMAGKSAPIEYDLGAPTGVFNRVGDPTLFNSIYTPRLTLEDLVVEAFGVD